MSTAEQDRRRERRGAPALGLSVLAGISVAAAPALGVPPAVVGTSTVAVGEGHGRTSTAALARAMEDDAKERAALEAAETTGVRSEGTPDLDLLLPLRAPELATELIFAPLLPLMIAFERLRLHERFFDLVTNDALTMALLPVVDVFNSSGLSAGAVFLRNDPLGSPDRMVVLGLYRANGDVEGSFSYTRRLRFLSGKRFHVGAEYSFDHDERYYGLGNATLESDERLIENESVDLEGWIEVPAPAVWNARIGAAWRRKRLTSGTGDSPGLAVGDAVTPPAGFGRTLHYPEVSVTFSYDSRDSESRPTRGVVAELSGMATHDLDDAETGGLQATAQLGVYIPVALLYRTLVLTAGASLASAVGSDNDIAYHSLVDLGGSKRLRGYESHRFVDRVGFWGTAEYRYKVFEWTGSGTGLSASAFADVGRVAPTPAELLDAPLAWSLGFGLRVEADVIFLGRFQLAYSPDGFRVVLAVNDIL